MKKKQIILKKKKTKLNIISKPLKKKIISINILVVLPFEQNVNVSYFYINLADFYFYKFSNYNKIWNFVNLHKILHSSILRKNFFSNFSIFKKIEKFLIFYDFFFQKKTEKIYKLSYLNTIFSLYLIFFYKFSNFNYFAFFKKRKSTDKKLLLINFLLNIQLNKFIYFYPFIWFESKKLKLINNFVDSPSKFILIWNKKWLFRSIPKKKIFNKIFEILHLNGNFSSFSNLQFTFFLKKFISIFFSYTKKTIIPILIRVLSVFNFYYYVILTFLIISNLEFYKLNYIIKSFKQLYFEEITYVINYFNIIKKYSTWEWFTKSYILNNNLKKFFLSYQGLSIFNTNITNKFNISNLYYRSLKILDTAYSFIDHSNNINFKYFLSNQLPFLNKLNFFSFKKKIFIEINFKIKRKNFIYKHYQKFFYFLSFVEKKFNLIKFYSDFYTLSLKINYLIIFNKYMWLDPASALLTNYFFSEPTTYNLNFFFWKFLNFFFLKILNTKWLISKFEVFFFKKNLFFRSSNTVNFFYTSALWTAEKSLHIFLFKVRRQHFFCLKENFWFNHKFFIEELFHLSYEYRHSDYEWIQEYVRVKQLAELRLVKLTDFLKWMRQQKKDPGNIQYSPDFTQQHEFALTLKWGLELESLRFTKIILIWRFFGNILKLKKNNFIKKKINFLYKLLGWDSTGKKFSRKNKIFSPNTLKIKEVYELIRLQLSSIVSSYRNIFKFKLNQLESFHYNFPLRTEQFKNDLYKFIFLSFDWYFIIKTYNKYYETKNIKKKTRLSKLINKKIFNRFVLSSTIFSNLLLFKNINFYFLFWFFWIIKKKILWTAKTKIFYQALLNLIIKTFKTFLLPSRDTLLDRNFYYLELNHLNNIRTQKFEIILKKNLVIQKLDFSRDNLSVNFFFLNIKKYLIQHVIKNFSFKNINISANKFYFFNFKNFNKFIFSDFEIFFDNLLINFFSEYIYDLFSVFLKECNLNLNLIIKNKYYYSKFFSWLNSDNFSKTFYSNLDDKNLSTTFFYNSISLKLILSKFLNNIYSKKNLKIFINKLKLFLILNRKNKNFEFLFKHKRILFINSILLILNKNSKFNNNIYFFIDKIVNNLIYRFLLFINNDSIKFFFKKLHFDKIWLKNFTNQLKLIINDFYFYILKLLIKSI